MDQQLIQSLMMCFQQGLTLLQQAQAGAGAGNPMGGDGMDDGDMAGGPDDGMDEGGMGDGGAVPPPMADGEDGDMDDMDGTAMGGGGTLHDRVQQLESHTGLKKSAQSLPLGERVDALEDEILGQQFEGPMVQRVAQLEKAVGGDLHKAADDEAPQEIPLDALIKSAIANGISQGMRQMRRELQKSAAADDGDDLPEPSTLRKNARQATYGQRRGQQHTVSGDADLIKAAQDWGMDVGSDEDLDQPIGFGDAMMALYQITQNGEAIPYSGDDDD